MTTKRPLLLFLSILLLAFLPGCEIIVGIFKAGFWTAIIVVVLVVGLLIYGVKKFLD